MDRVWQSCHWPPRIMTKVSLGACCQILSLYAFPQNGVSNNLASSSKKYATETWSLMARFRQCTKEIVRPLKEEQNMVYKHFIGIASCKYSFFLSLAHSNGGQYSVSLTRAHSGGRLRLQCHCITVRWTGVLLCAQQWHHIRTYQSFFVYLSTTIT